MKRKCCSINCIMPPHLLDKLLKSDRQEVRDAAMKTLLATTQLRGQREVRELAGFMPSPAAGRRTISDCGGSTLLQEARVARTEGSAKTSDDSVNRAYDGFGSTREFYKEVLQRNSLDNRGMRLDGFVHYDVGFNNAFWDGQEMVFGDGDGVIFADFTLSLDVIAHELTHGVTEFTAALEYHNQSGALNESISDVFGSMVKQWASKQTVGQADWLIGAEVFTPGMEADALRSMKEPGTAYNNDELGQDPQPGHMRDFKRLPDTRAGDNGGVHINSGIPNKAFYLTCRNMGEDSLSWEAPGHVWYASLLAANQRTDFQEFADTTYMQAGRIFGGGSDIQRAVLDAWGEVGIQVNRNLELRAAVALPDGGSGPGPIIEKQVESINAYGGNEK